MKATIMVMDGIGSIKQILHNKTVAQRIHLRSVALLFASISAMYIIPAWSQCG